MGTRLKDVYPHATKWQVFKYRIAIFVRRIIYTILAIAFVYGVYELGGALKPAVTVFMDREVIKEVDARAPVMDRIAKCESGGKHLDKNGQVLMRPNTNGTVDVGVYQINSVHFSTATAMGLDITKEADNRTFAYYLYKTQGTEPWYSSKHCWN